jgi:hypothetical protein
MFLAITSLVTLLIAMLLGAFFPRTAFLRAEKDALRRGWPISIIRLTRATQFFTLFGQTLVTIALFTNHTSLTVVAFVLDLVVAILYHGICRIDPSLLSYDDPHLARKVTALLPPMDEHFIVWLGLHGQHTVVPLLLWMSGVPFQHYVSDTWICMGLFILYSIHNLFCWKVNGIAAYPIQQVMWDHGLYIPAWLGCLTLVYIVANVNDYFF